MAALTMIDRDLYDAARVDGAGVAQRFRYVTFPNIRPIVVVLLTYHALVALTSYDLVYAMTAGGPGPRRRFLLPDLAGELLDDELRHRFGDRLPPGAAVARVHGGDLAGAAHPAPAGPLSRWLDCTALVHLAGLLLFVCAGPVGLSLFASVMPDQAIFGFPPNWFGYDATLDNYRYIFTGQIPAVYPPPVPTAA